MTRQPTGNRATLESICCPGELTIDSINPLSTYDPELNPIQYLELVPGFPDEAKYKTNPELANNISGCKCFYSDQQEQQPGFKCGCPAGLKWNEATKQCDCAIAGQIKVSKTKCECPGDLVFDGGMPGSCVCPSPDHIRVGNSCTCPDG